MDAKETLVTTQWIESLAHSMRVHGRQQLVDEESSYRLLALALFAMVRAYMVLSADGTAEVRSMFMRELDQVLSGLPSDEGDVAPPTVEQIGIVLDMAALGVAMLDARRGRLGLDEKDLLCQDLATALAALVYSACVAGGPKAAATLIWAVKRS